MPSLTKVQPAFILAQGAIELDSGTASAPSLKFATSSATGMFSPSTGTLAFSTGSTQNALSILANGNVGVGLTNPSRKLDIQIQTASLEVGSVLSSHPIAEFINLSGGATRGLEIGCPADSVTSPVYLKVAGTANRFAILNQSDSEQLTILNSGNVGIGTTNPTSKLEVSGTINSSSGLRTLEQVRATGWWNTPTGSSYSGFAVEMGMSSGAGYVLCYNRDSSTYGTLNIQSGSTVIQLPATGSTINVTGSLTASGSVSASGASGFYSTTYIVNTRNPIWRFANADEYGLSYFQGSAGVSPAGGGDTIGFHFGTPTAAGSLLQLNNGSGAVINGTLGVTGNVGIGTTNPASKLDVTGTVTATNFADSTGGYNVNLGSNSIEGRALVAGYSGGSYGGIGYNVRHSSTSAIYIAPSNDTSNYLLFNQGFTFYGATGGAAGRTLSYTTLANLNSSGNLTLTGATHTANGNAIWHAGNDGSGSGLDADLLDGQNGTYYRQAWSSVDAGTRLDYSLGFQAPVSGYSGFYFSKSTSGATTGDAGYLLIRGTSDNDIYTAEGITLVADAGWLTLAQRTTASRGVRIMSGTTSAERLKITTAGDIQFLNGNSLTYNANTIWHAGNDGAGSGLDADLLDGLELHTSRNNESNKVVRTDGSGYIQAGWINTISGNLGVTARLDRVYTSNDAYIRYLNLTDFKNQMGLSSKNNYSRAVDYTSNVDYWVGSFGHSGYGANETFHGGSGFFDIWGGTNYPGSFSHIHGINMLHYTVNSLGSTGGVAYGWQLATQYNSDAGPYWRRCNAGGFSNWRQIWHDTNDGAGSGLDADLLDGNNSSYFLDTSSNTQTKTGRLNIHGDLLVAVNGTTANHIVQRPYTINNGTLSWEGSAGQLFSITNNLTTGSIFSVNDVSGIPSIDVDADGTVKLAPFNGTVAIKQITETSVNNFNTTLSPSSGTLTIDTSVGTVILGDLNASVITWAFTNVPTANNRATTITLIIDGDTSQTYGEACSVNGSTIVGGVKWAGGSAPASTDAFDIISFTIVKDGAGTINVFGSGNTNLFT
jgi:hypothetical protein